MGERWLVTGAGGQLGGHVLARLRADPRVARAVALLRRASGAAVDEIVCDLSDADAFSAIVRETQPTHVAHLGAMTSVVDCYARPDAARLVNTQATAVLASAAATCGSRFVFSSTDMVFAGDAAPYDEDAPARPLSVYGRTKLDAEAAVLAARGLVVRLPLMFGRGRGDRPTTYSRQLDDLKAGRAVRLFTDEFRTPLWVEDAARVVIELGRSDASGILHAAGPERLSRLEMIARCGAALGTAPELLTPVSRLSIASDEPRPADLSLCGEQIWRSVARWNLARCGELCTL
jgi:dTDP-4-dehydrorhamnose reductase